MQSLFRKFRTLRLAAMLCVGLASVSIQSVYGQTGTVVLPTREVTMKQAVYAINAQTDYRFVVNWAGGLDASKKHMMPANRMAVEALLKRILLPEGYKYEVKDKYIVISPAAKKEQPQSTDRPARESAYQSAAYEIPEIQQGMEAVPDPYAKNNNVEYSSIVLHSEGGIWGADNSDNRTDIVMLHFRLGKSMLERDFMDNARSLDIIDKTFSDKDFVVKMKYVVITAGSSPDGGETVNRRLARERAKAVRSYIMWKHPEVDRNKLIAYSIGEDWSGLANMVKDDKNVPNKEQVLEIISNPNYSNSRRKADLMKLDGGRSYEYIVDNMLPLLRGAAACMIFFEKESDKEEPQIIVAEEYVEAEPIVEEDTTAVVEEPFVAPVITPEVKEKDDMFVVLKTNLLYDAALTPNLAVELYLGNNWSIEAEGNGAFWKTNGSTPRRHELATGGLEVRKWFGRNKAPLNGHFVGLYGMVGEYDIKYGSKGYQSDGLSYSAGLTYGYAMPVSRKLNLEFSLGLGYLGGEYKKYTYDKQDDCFPWLGTSDRNYFGPTKAEVSLVWLIGNRYNKKYNK